MRLKSNSSLVATYTYDALGRGRRIGKVVGSDTTRYVHAGVQAIEEVDGTTSGANLRRLYVFGERIDRVVAMEAPDAADVDGDSNTSEVLRFSFHTQLVGSVTQVTAPSGSVAESYEYDPYGKPTIKDAGGSTISASAIGNSYLFTARQLDAETGLYYYRARHYSPELRRFVQRDPLEYVDGPSALGYVGGRPVSRSDAEGLSEKEVINKALQAGYGLHMLGVAETGNWNILASPYILKIIDLLRKAGKLESANSRARDAAGHLREFSGDKTIGDPNGITCGYSSDPPFRDAPGTLGAALSQVPPEPEWLKAAREAANAARTRQEELASGGLLSAEDMLALERERELAALMDSAFEAAEAARAAARELHHAIVDAEEEIERFNKEHEKSQSDKAEEGSGGHEEAPRPARASRPVR